MSHVPTSWYEGEHLLAKLRAYDVPQSDPAWCVATGHIWGPYIPARMPLPPVYDFNAAPTCDPIKAYRYCARCDAAQDYQGAPVHRAER